MGFDDECFRQPVDAMIDAALASGVPQTGGINRERLERDPSVRLNLNGDGNGEPWLPFAKGFPTPTGKARLYDGELIALGMDPLHRSFAGRVAAPIGSQAVSAGIAGAQSR